MKEITPIIILAAGESARLGRAKQLLPYKGTSLIKYVVRECKASQLGEVIVVVGAKVNEIKNQIEGCSVVTNKNWSQGMGTSIAAGVSYAQSIGASGVYIVLVDQPFFNKEVLGLLANKQIKDQCQVVLSKYEVGMGPPVYFDQCFFSDLIKLTRDQGAKGVLEQLDTVPTIPFPKGHTDIDRIEDLDWLEN